MSETALTYENITQRAECEIETSQPLSQATLVQNTLRTDTVFPYKDNATVNNNRHRTSEYIRDHN